MTEQEEREERRLLVAEARSWDRTPYHHRGQIKGVGVDCLTLVVCCFRNAGLADYGAVPTYPPDWHLHRSEERYLTGVLEYCEEVASHDALAPEDSALGCAPRRIPLGGDIVMFRFGRAFSHAAIVTDWPRAIHADIAARRVVEIDVEATAWLKTIGERVAEQGSARPRKILRLKRWKL